MATEEQIEKLVNDHFELAERAARNRFAGIPNYYSICFDDWLSDAMLGLLDAATKFDPDKGVKFSTYSIRRINGAMLDGERKRDHLPRSARQKVKRGEREDISIVSIDRCLPDSNCPYSKLLACRDPPPVEFGEGLHQCLNPEEIQMLKSYFHDGKTMKQIGQGLGLSESRISQMFSNIRSHLHVYGRESVREMLT